MRVYEEHEREYYNAYKRMVEEQNNKNRYEYVIFLRNKDADKVFDGIKEHGEDEIVDYLVDTFYKPGMADISPEIQFGDLDIIYQKGEYIMAYSVLFRYVALYKDNQYKETDN